MRIARACILISLFLMAGAFYAKAATVADAQAFMDQAEAELLALNNDQQQAEWVHETYITPDTEVLSARALERVIGRTTELVEQAKQFAGLDLPPELRRKFMLLKLGLPMPAPQDPKLRAELTRIATSLNGSYGAGKYCPGNDSSKCMGVDELEVRMAQSRDPKELQDLWEGWHKIGAPMRERYARFVELSNDGARVCR